MAGERHRTTVSEIWLEEDGIIRWKYDAGVEVTRKEALEEVEAMDRFFAEGGVVKRATLIDISSIKSVSKEARKLFSSEENSEKSLGVAILTGSLVSQVIGNFFVGLDRPPHPIRLFSAEEKALRWLKKLR